MADTVIENLITKLSFDFDEDKLEEFQEGLETAAKGLVAIVAAATAAATAIFAFARSIAESNDELGKFARRIGVDVGALQELGFVAELNGGSIDSMNSSLENLIRISSEASRGIGAGVEVFGILGISVTDATGRLKEADVLLEDVADSISRLGSQAQRLEFAQKLGIGGDLLLAIQQGSEAIRRQRQEARALGFVIDKDAADAAGRFNDEMLRVMSIVKGVANAIGTKLIRQLTPLIKIFTEWFKINKAIIQQNISRFLEGVVDTIRKVQAIAFRVLGILNSLVNAMGGWKNTIIAATALLLTMNASALLMPILAIAAGAAILLILEDIIKFAEGGDSAIGSLTDKFPVLESVIWGLLDLLAMIRDGWVLIFQDGEEALEGAILMIRDLRTEFKLLDDIISGISKLFSTITEGWRLIFSGEGTEALKEAIELIKDVKEELTIAATAPITRKGFFESLTAPFTQRNNTERISGAQPGSPVNKSLTNNVTDSRTVNININGGDIDKVKEVVKGVLAEEYSGAQTNLESQVEY